MSERGHRANSQDPSRRRVRTLGAGIVLCATTLSLAGCESTPSPVVDTNTPSAASSRPRTTQPEASSPASSCDVGAMLSPLAIGHMLANFKRESGRLPKRTGPGGAALRPVTALPGFGRATLVPTLQREQLRCATVKQVITDEASVGAGANTNWTDGCDALKVSPNTVVTAAHCLYLPDITGQPDKGGAYARAQNVTARLSKSFGIRLPGLDHVGGPVAPVVAAAANLRLDYALLRVDTSDPASAAFNALPAIPNYAQRLARIDTAKPGEEVTVFTMPSAAHGKVVEGVGIFLGLAKDPTTPGRKLNYIGYLGVEYPRDDPVNWGASGSQPVLEFGALLGPLGSRGYIGYKPDASANPPDDVPLARQYRRELENTLGLDLSLFTSHGGYSPIAAGAYTDLNHVIG